MRSESTRHRQGWTLVLASLGVFMVALDTLVVSTALPVLRVDFGASLGDLEWTVANAVVGSVPMAQVGVASGVNSAIRELGGVCGVAVLAATFTHHGVYGSAQASTDRFSLALWVAVGLSAAGMVPAMLSQRPRRFQRVPVVVTSARLEERA